MRSLCAGILLCSFLAAAAAQTGEEKKLLDALQGEWTVAGLEYNGKNMADKFKLVFVFKGNVASVEGDEAVRTEYAKLSFKFDPSTDPKCVDLTVLGGIQKDATMEGIYELKGDELRLCVKVFGKDRPNEFKSPDGSSIVLLTLKRAK